ALHSPSQREEEADDAHDRHARDRAGEAGGEAEAPGSRCEPVGQRVPYGPGVGARGGGGDDVRAELRRRGRKGAGQRPRQQYGEDEADERAPRGQGERNLHLAQVADRGDDQKTDEDRVVEEDDEGLRRDATWRERGLLADDGQVEAVAHGDEVEQARE